MEVTTATPNNPLIEELEAFVKMTESSGIDMANNYHLFVLKKAESIQVVSLSEIFSKEKIQEIKFLVNPKVNECWKNAALFCLYYPDVKYVEGKMLAAGVIGVNHAFNKIGDKYVDITAELVLNDLHTEEGNYIKIQEYDNQEILDLCDKHQQYCCFFEHNFYRRKFVKK